MFKTFNTKVAGILPGLKTRICIIAGVIVTFVSAMDPTLVAPIIPPSYQPYMPLVFFTATYYAHHLTKLHE